MEVRDMIYKLMQEKDITYAELERRTGIPKSMLNRYVTGKTKKIPIDNMEKIAKGLNVKPTVFVLGNFEIEPPEGKTYIDPAADIAREATGSVPEEPSIDEKHKRAEFLIETLDRLTKMYKDGLLSAEEFKAAKAKILDL